MSQLITCPKCRGPAELIRNSVRCARCSILRRPAATQPNIEPSRTPLMDRLIRRRKPNRLRRFGIIGAAAIVIALILFGLGMSITWTMKSVVTILDGEKQVVTKYLGKELGSIKWRVLEWIDEKHGTFLFLEYKDLLRQELNSDSFFTWYSHEKFYSSRAKATHAHTEILQNRYVFQAKEPLILDGAIVRARHEVYGGDRWIVIDKDYWVAKGKVIRALLHVESEVENLKHMKQQRKLNEATAGHEAVLGLFHMNDSDDNERAQRPTIERISPETEVLGDESQRTDGNVTDELGIQIIKSPLGDIVLENVPKQFIASGETEQPAASMENMSYSVENSQVIIHGAPTGETRMQVSLDPGSESSGEMMIRAWDSIEAPEIELKHVNGRVTSVTWNGRPIRPANN